MGEGNYTFTNSKGVLWYLHTREVNLKNGRVQRIYFFAKDERDDACPMPEGYEVMETKRTFMPVLKKA